ncbi:MAG: hypothetical protein ACE5IJ_12130 [Thermoplasmata archaeon]
MPLWEDISEVFQASGAIPPRNWDVFLRWLRAIQSEAMDSQRIVNPVALAVDTNVAYLHLFSRYLGLDHEEARGFTVLVSQGVRAEIDHHIGAKASRQYLRELYRVPSLAPYIEELGNRNALETRRAKLAQNELDYLTVHRRALRVPCGPFTGNKESFDIEIARSYAAFAQQNRLSGYLLTYDQNMADHAKNVGLPCFVLEMPDLSAFVGASMEGAFASVLHDLAVLFGVVLIEPFEIRVWGEWKGKTSADYESERVRVDIDSRHSIAELFARDTALGYSLLEMASRFRSGSGS